MEEKPSLMVSQIKLALAFLGAIFWLYGLGSIAALVLGYQAKQEFEANESSKIWVIAAWLAVFGGVIGLLATVVYFIGKI